MTNAVNQSESNLVKGAMCKMWVCTSDGTAPPPPTEWRVAQAYTRGNVFTQGFNQRLTF